MILSNSSDGYLPHAQVCRRTKYCNLCCTCALRVVNYDQCSSFIVATHDVQSAVGSTTGASNEITVTGEFIQNTTASGCFIVLQSESGSPDVFRALLLPANFKTSVESIITNIPPSTYHMLVYDLEEDGLPNSTPAVEQNNSVTVEGEGECLLVYYINMWLLSIFYYRFSL